MDRDGGRLKALRHAEKQLDAAWQIAMIKEDRLRASKIRKTYNMVFDKLKKLTLEEVPTMKVYTCLRCGSKHDFASIAEDRLCDKCGAPLAYSGIEASPWGEHPMKDPDAVSN